MPVQLTESAITKGMKAAALMGSASMLQTRVVPAYGCAWRPAARRAWALCCRDREGRMRRYQLGAWPARWGSAKPATRHVRCASKSGSAAPIP